MSGSSSAIQTDNTTAQNIATGINGIINASLQINGAVNAAALTITTLVKGSPGRVATVVVLDGGSADGAIYDNVDPTSTLRQVYAIPQSQGVVFLNMPCSYGIVVAPGTGQSVTVSYS